MTHLNETGTDASQALPHLATCVDFESTENLSREGAIGWDTFCKDGKGASTDPAQVSEEDLCLIIFTSGTTGQPKGVTDKPYVVTGSKP